MTRAKLRELFASIGATLGEKDEDTDEGTLTLDTVTSTFRQVAPTVYQRVFDAGHSERHKRAERELKELNDKLATTTAELEQLRAGNTGQTDDQKTARIRELETQVATLAKEKKDLEASSRASLVEARRDVELARLGSLLTGGEGERLDPEYAEVLLERRELRERIRVNDDDTVDVLGPSGVPFAPGEGKTVLSLLRDEVVERAKRDKPRMVLVEVDSGSDVGRAQRSGGPQGGDAKMFEDIRKEVQTRETAASSAAGPSAAERMGLGLRMVGGSRATAQ